MNATDSGKTSPSHFTAVLTVQTTWLRGGTRQEALSFPSELGLSLSRIPGALRQVRRGQGIQWAPWQGLVFFEVIYILGQPDLGDSLAS